MGDFTFDYWEIVDREKGIVRGVGSIGGRSGRVNVYVSLDLLDDKKFLDEQMPQITEKTMRDNS